MPRPSAPTGKILLRLDEELHARLIRLSGPEGPAKLLRRYVAEHLVPGLERRALRSADKTAGVEPGP